VYLNGIHHIPAHDTVIYYGICVSKSSSLHLVLSSRHRWMLHCACSAFLPRVGTQWHGVAWHDIKYDGKECTCGTNDDCTNISNSVHDDDEWYDVAIVCIPFHFPTCSIPVGIFQVVLVVVVVVVIILVDDDDDDDDVSKSE